MGNANTTGSELKAIAGARLRDGEGFMIDGMLFEFLPVNLEPQSRKVSEYEPAILDGMVVLEDQVATCRWWIESSFRPCWKR